VDSGDPWNITYGTGFVAGSKVTDNVIVAGLTLTAQAFGIATVESTDFSNDSIPFDGLMGLASSVSLWTLVAERLTDTHSPQSLSQQGNPTPVESLASAQLIPGAITSYKIPRLADGLNDGEITFGGLDPNKFDPSTIVTLPNVSPTGFWEADMDDVTVDGNDLGLTGRSGILDTGTTLIIAPQADAVAVHNAIPGAQSDGQGGFTIPCTTNVTIALSFGGTFFSIDTRDIVIQPLDASEPAGVCISGISAGSVGTSTEWLVCFSSPRPCLDGVLTVVSICSSAMCS
jgi:hypothetical protein